VENQGNNMADVFIKLSQQTVDQQNAIIAKYGKSSLITGAVDFFAQLSYYIESYYYYYDSFSFSGDTFRANYRDKSYTALTGSFSDTTKASGTAVIKNETFFKPNDFSMSSSGQIKYDWTAGPYGPSYNVTSGNIEKINLTTRVLANSKDYDPFYGNVRINLDGNINFNQSRDLSGYVTEYRARADKLLSSSIVKGNIELQGNFINIALGLENSRGFGSIRYVEDIYFDGSRAIFDFVDSPIFFDDISSVSNALENSDFFRTNDSISIDLPSRLYEPFIIESGMGDDVIRLSGGGGKIFANAGPGNDAIYLLKDNQFVDGGEGLDTAFFTGVKSRYSVDLSGPSATVRDLIGSDGLNTLINIERIVFSDVGVATDIGGVAGQAYRIYKAAFDRAPDLSGLGFWINAMDKGVTLTTVAGGFIRSAEFQSRYGAASDTDFIKLLYENVLDRQPDDGGYAFWQNAMERGLSREGVLVEFSESPENKAYVSGLIAGGIEYTPFIG